MIELTWQYGGRNPQASVNRMLHASALQGTAFPF